MANKVGWRRIYQQFEDYWQVLRHQTQPLHTSIYYNRLQLIVLWNYPNHAERESWIKRAWHAFILIHINAFLLTLVCALPESADDLVTCGQDILWIIANMYLCFKWHFLSMCVNNVDEVIDALDICHTEEKLSPAKGAIRREQRTLFLIESTMSLAWHFGVVGFLFLAMMQPVWGSQSLPFHAVYPFDWHDPDKHPTAHAIIYGWQCFALGYNMICVLYFELLSAHIFTQLGINMKIMCLELNSLAEINSKDEQLYRREFRRVAAYHQRIISLVKRTNEVFFATMIMQLIESFLLISLSTFEALANRRNPSVAMRFVLFMMLSFLHLSYWCVAGNMVTEHSGAVAQAAYSAYAWSPPTREFQRDLMFIMFRAQKPLGMAAAPFPPFNISSYTAILKQCYSILTVLLESLD